MDQPKLEKIAFKLLFILPLLLITQVCAMTNTEKYLSLEINSENLNYYIMFNGVKVYSTIGNAPMKQTVPINQWVLNGENTLLVSVNLKDDAFTRYYDFYFMKKMEN